MKKISIRSFIISVIYLSFVFVLSPLIFKNINSIPKIIIKIYLVSIYIFVYVSLLSFLIITFLFLKSKLQKYSATRDLQFQKAAQQKNKSL